MQLYRLILVGMFFSCSLCAQDSFSNIISYENTEADLGSYIEVYNGELLVVASHFCAPGFQDCTSVSKFSFDGKKGSTNFITGFDPIRGSGPMLIEDTLFLLGLDRIGDDRAISLLKYTTNKSLSEINNINKDGEKIFLSEGILEFNNAFYIYGHYDDLTPGERIKGFVKKWNRDFTEELGSWIFGHNGALRISDMRVSRDSNLVFTFFENQAGAGPELNVRIISIDTLGNINNEFIIPDSRMEGSTKVNLAIGDDGNLFVNHDANFRNNISKVNANLNGEIWNLVLPFDYYPYDRGYSVTELIIAENGDLIAVGEVDYVHQDIERVYSTFITRINADTGAIIWLKMLTHEITAPNVFGFNYAESYLYDIQELPNGNIVGVGQLIQGTFDGALQQLWLLSIDENGCMEGFDCEDDIYILNAFESIPFYTSTKDLLIIDENIIYPNPVHDILNIDLNPDFQYEILNTQGQILLQGTSNKEVDVRDLPEGIYFLQLSQGGDIYQSKKFVKL